MFGGKFLDVLILMIPIHRILPFLAWPRLTLRLLHHETLAGVAVGLMVLPQGVAYAALAGMPLVTGIYASILPALISSCRRPGPTPGDRVAEKRHLVAGFERDFSLRQAGDAAPGGEGEDAG